MADNGKSNPFNNASAQKITADSKQSKGKQPQIVKGNDLRSK
jgi:hypothetical protein